MTSGSSKFFGHPAGIEMMTANPPGTNGFDQQNSKADRIAKAIKELEKSDEKCAESGLMENKRASW